MNIPIPWMDCFLSVIPGSDEPIGNIWTDGSEILVKTEAAANAIADLIKMLYEADEENIQVLIGYYDPKYDEEYDQVDEYTDWWYVSIE